MNNNTKTKQYAHNGNLYFRVSMDNFFDTLIDWRQWDKERELESCEDEISDRLESLYKKGELEEFVVPNNPPNFKAIEDYVHSLEIVEPCIK